MVHLGRIEANVREAMRIGSDDCGRNCEVCPLGGNGCSTFATLKQGDFDTFGMQNGRLQTKKPNLSNTPKSVKSVNRVSKHSKG